MCDDKFLPERLLKSIMEFQKSNAKFLETINNISKMMSENSKGLIESQKAIQAAISPLIPTINSFAIDMGKNLDVITNFVNNSNIAKVQMLVYEHIQPLTNNIDYIHKIVQSYQNDLTDLKSKDEPIDENIFEEVIKSVSERELDEYIESNQLKPNMYQSILISIKTLIAIISLFVSLSTVSNYEVTKINIEEVNINISNPEFNKDLMNNPLEEVFQENANYRIVTKEELIVRKNKSKQSDIATRLEQGSVVEIIDKKRNWSYILHRNEDGDPIVGWTNTKHLTKIK